MNMNMRYRLSRERAYIHADIITIRIEFLVNTLFHPVHKLPDCRFFFRRGIEVFGYMSMRNDQAVARIHGVTVIAYKSQFILDNNFGFPAERTIRVIS